MSTYARRYHSKASGGKEQSTKLGKKDTLKFSMKLVKCQTIISVLSSLNYCYGCFGKKKGDTSFNVFSFQYFIDAIYTIIETICSFWSKTHISNSLSLAMKLYNSEVWKRKKISDLERFESSAKLLDKDSYLEHYIKYEIFNCK